MANSSKKPRAPRPYFPHSSDSFHNNVGVRPHPYTGNQTFKDMREKAEQAMAIHEFKD